LIVRSIVAGKFPNMSHGLSVGMLLFLLTGLIAQFGAANADVGWEWIDSFARLTLVSLFMVALTDTHRRFLLTVLVIAGSLGFYTIKAGLISLLGGGLRFGQGLAGAYTDNNAYALAAVMIMPLLLALSQNIPDEWRFRKWLVWGLRIGIPLTCFSAISTFSRGGLLALSAATITYVMLFSKRRFATIAGLALIVLVAMPLVPLPAGYTERMQTIVTYEDVGEESAVSRLHFWAVAWEMAKDQPLGVGMRNFDYAYDQYDFLQGRFGHQRAVHNSHLEVLTEQGFLGFFIWIAMFTMAFRRCARMRRIADKELAGTAEGRFIRTMAAALVVSMIAFLVGGTFIALALNELTWMTFALVAALDRITTATVGSHQGGSVKPSKPMLRSIDAPRRSTGDGGT
jgi:putative inorganic carbon (HCO3(-)) transporter